MMQNLYHHAIIEIHDYLSENEYLFFFLTGGLLVQ
jgi:hypothetical protein